MEATEAGGLAKLEAELKEMIIEALALEDVTPEEIQSEEPLFVEGLGLDSIDALEIAMAVEERYSVVMGEDPEENRAHFASLRSLAGFIASSRAK